MSASAPRLFADAAAVRQVGEGMIGRTLPKAEWTHEAHLGTCLYILAERRDIVAQRDLPGLISAYNVSLGGVNDDHNGYHETITQCFIAAVRAHLAERPAGEDLATAVNALLLSPRGERGYPLTLYSRERLFSVAARRGYVTPDL